jgi:hypothetical protein
MEDNVTPIKKDEYIAEENHIELFFHCSKCFPDRPSDISPMEWSDTQTGWTQPGLQVWCNRCDANICHIDFEGVKHPATTNRLAD